jgi:hypothetical protein
MRPRTPKRAAQDTAEHDALAALTETIGGCCEWCSRHKKLDPHHVAQGSSKHNAIGDLSLILLLCRDCHDALHGMRSIDRYGASLALLYHAGRMNLRRFYDALDREYPPEPVVRHWIDRFSQHRRSAG